MDDDYFDDYVRAVVAVSYVAVLSSVCVCVTLYS